MSMGTSAAVADGRGVRLEVEVVPVRNAVVVRPLGGSIDSALAGDFRGALMEAIRAGHQNVVVDLGAVAFIDSAGLGALVSALKMLRIASERRAELREGRSRRPAVRGDVRLACVQTPVVSLLEIIRLNRVFSSYLTVDEAVDSFS